MQWELKRKERFRNGGARPKVEEKKAKELAVGGLVGEIYKGNYWGGEGKLLI